MKGASLESETTAAALEKEGVRKFNLMAILDFLSAHIGDYLKNYLEFGRKLKSPPKIFAVNYFLKDKDGKYLNDKVDKAVWLKWMELRVHNEVGAVETPIGYLPFYEDLKKLFLEVLRKEYSKEEYEKQFMIRVPQLLKKIERIRNIYREVENVPEEVFKEISEEEERLRKARKRHGDYISPFSLYS